MGRKKSKAVVKPFCWYCDREFDDEQILLNHQRAKHFKCGICHKRLNGPQGLAIHYQRLHRETITSIPNALPHRNSLSNEVIGMSGIPSAEDEQREEDELKRKKSIDAQTSMAAAAAAASVLQATGNPEAAAAAAAAISSQLKGLIAAESTSAAAPTSAAIPPRPAPPMPSSAQMMMPPNPSAPPPGFSAGGVGGFSSGGVGGFGANRAFGMPPTMRPPLAAMPELNRPLLPHQTGPLGPGAQMSNPPLMGNSPMMNNPPHMSNPPMGNPHMSHPHMGHHPQSGSQSGPYGNYPPPSQPPHMRPPGPSSQFGAPGPSSQFGAPPSHSSGGGYPAQPPLMQMQPHLQQSQSPTYAAARSGGPAGGQYGHTPLLGAAAAAAAAPPMTSPASGFILETHKVSAAAPGTTPAVVSGGPTERMIVSPLDELSLEEHRAALWLRGRGGFK